VKKPDELYLNYIEKYTNNNNRELKYLMLPDNPNKENVYDKNKLNSIVLAGGCFWGTQAYI